MSGPTVLNDAQYPFGMVQPALHRQHLSHHSLHFSTLPQLLANISASIRPTSELQQKSIAVIVGVEYGPDVRRFANEGYHVIAFEPMELFYNFVRERIVDTHPEWAIDLRNIALGNESDTIVNIDYRNFTAVPVPATTLDALFVFHGEENRAEWEGKTVLHQDVAVMSIDVQGFELDVLQGAVEFLKHVQVLWFEMAACNPKTRLLFDLLDRHFVLFDFVPVGLPPQARINGYRGRENFLVNETRPGSFDGFYDWLCGWRSERGYKRVQTDVVAVRRDVVSEIVGELEEVGQKVCKEDDDKEEVEDSGEQEVGGKQGQSTMVVCRLRWLDQRVENITSGGRRRR